MTKQIKTKTMVLCNYCCQAIRSHGEKVYVGNYADDEYDKCEFCDDTREDVIDLFECQVGEG